MNIMRNRGKQMNYTKLISKKKQYKYSVNICFDLHSEERLADFIPNVTTTEIIREYLGITDYSKIIPGDLINNLLN